MTQAISVLPESMREKKIRGVVLNYWPPVVLPGEELTIRLYVKENAPNQANLEIKLNSEQGQLLASKSTEVSLNLATISPCFITKLEIPENLSEGVYVLQVWENQTVLASAELELTGDKDYANYMKHFAEALNKQEEVATALEFGNYERALALQKNCEVLYILIDNKELAARYWEQLAEKLFDLDAFNDAKKALEYSLVLFEAIEYLENRDKILERIREEVKICENRRNLPTVNIVNIEALRKKLAYSREAVAVSVGVNPRNIENWEKGYELESLKFYLSLLALYPKNIGLENENLVVDISKLKVHLKNLIQTIKTQGSYETEQLSASIGASPNIIEDWESGNNLEMLNKFFMLSRVLRCSISSLLGHSTVSQPNPSRESSHPSVR
jgi:DNA-binding XRE family transcriptional regulator